MSLVICRYFACSAKFRALGQPLSFGLDQQQSTNQSSQPRHSQSRSRQELRLRRSKPLESFFKLMSILERMTVPPFFRIKLISIFKQFHLREIANGSNASTRVTEAWRNLKPVKATRYYGQHLARGRHKAGSYRQAITESAPAPRCSNVLQTHALASPQPPKDKANDWGAAYGSRFTFVALYLPAYPGRSVGVNVCIRDLSDFSVSLRWTMDTHYPLISWRPCKLFANHWQILSWTI